MTRKFFLIRRFEPVGTTKRFSENGKDLSILAIPSDQVSFISAGAGEVNITFNNAGMYEDNALFVGDSIEKTNISIACQEGEEMNLIESMIGFMSKDDGRLVMRFDAVDNVSSFKQAIVQSSSDLVAKIKSQPTEMVSQKISSGDVANRFANIIGEINFGTRENKPFIDYNHQSMYPVDNTDIVAVVAAVIKNAGTGGAAYDISGGTGSVTTQTEATAAATGLGQICTQFAVNSFLDVPDVTIRDDYTMYFVIGDPGSGSSGNGFGVLFGDDAGETTGFSVIGNPDTFSMRHDGLIGDPFKIKTSSFQNGTSSYKFPDRSTQTGIGERQFCYVFVIRRDKDFNMYLYNHEGDLVAFVPAFTVTSTVRSKISEAKEQKQIKSKTYKSKEEVRSEQSNRKAQKQGYSTALSATGVTQTQAPKSKKTKVTEGAPGRTDGNLLIQQLGSAGSNVTDSFSLTLGRFGIIKRDTGDAFCSQLAQDLYALYKPTA